MFSAFLKSIPAVVPFAIKVLTKKDAVLDTQPIVLHVVRHVCAVENVVQKDQTIAEFERRRPELLRREPLAQRRVAQFRVVDQRWLTAADEFQAGAVYAAWGQRNPTRQQLGHRDDRAGFQGKTDS